ncbi:hypothetical protein HF680_01250 [Brevundimonas sp. WCHBH090558]|uniref:hypothetical protein n=1 Tax=Brevundimonas huaxiensis TaxID=2725493 RepID=UPI0016252182|nr:hypothetical protein [Brevundimonas huaxiensis]MBC1181285.1 hypothetical protein [Brevundimonas huaxiensis]
MIANTGDNASRCFRKAWEKTVISALLVSAAAAQALACAPPVGSDVLMRHDRPRFVVIGEVHGTVETPSAFGELVCAATEQGPVVAALELPDLLQPQLEAALEAPDEASARAALEGTWFLNPRIDDGRTSRAMLALINRLRVLKASGRDVAIHAFVPSVPHVPGVGQAYSELQMATKLSSAAYAHPNAKILVLVGSIHASKIISRNPRVGRPAIAHLPQEDVISLLVSSQGGEAWNCRETCGVHPMTAADDRNLRGVVMRSIDDGAYDGLLALGPSTASPQAALAATP